LGKPRYFGWRHWASALRGIALSPFGPFGVGSLSQTGSNNRPLATRSSKYWRSIRTRLPALTARNRFCEIQRRMAEGLIPRKVAVSRTVKKRLSMFSHLRAMDIWLLTRSFVWDQAFNCHSQPYSVVMRLPYDCHATAKRWVPKADAPRTRRTLARNRDHYTGSNPARQILRFCGRVLNVCWSMNS